MEEDPTELESDAGPLSFPAVDCRRGLATIPGAGPASCEADSGGIDCVTPIEVAHLPVPWYGRFCGGGRPTGGDPDTDDDFDVAVDRGAIDGLDQSCLHHDLSGSWYSEASGPLNWGDGAACIVRYALRHSRLTQDGVVLTHGADNVVSWDSAWGDMMPRLKQGLDVYFSVVRDRCGPVRLDNFTQATAWF